MKKIISLLLILLTFLGIGFSANAETQYVSENLNTYLRKGAGDQFKLVGTIKSGEAVTILNKKDKYTQIRDSRNREGWILTSELTPNASSKEQLPVLQKQIDELTLRLNRINNDWQQRTNEMQRRTQQAEKQSSELLEQNSQLNRQVEILKNKNKDLEAMLDSEKRGLIIRWFIYGGSVLAVGLILGLIIPMIIPRRRRDRW
ncbi:TIGR04211 family SH3 domain-containing protein [Gallibacterium sp. ZY190522]